MAVKIHCPQCDAPIVYEDRDGESEVTCGECYGKFIPSDARSGPRTDSAPPDSPRPIASANSRPWDRRRRRDDDDDDDRPRRRRRRRRPPSSDPIREQLYAPAIFLLIIAFLQTIFHIVIFVLFVAMSLEDNRGRGKVGLFLCPCVLGLLAACKDAVVIRGAVAMLKGRSYGWAMAGAIGACLPDFGWVIALIPAIWCLVVLNNPHVRQAFNGYRYYDEEDEDDF